MKHRIIATLAIVATLAMPMAASAAGIAAPVPVDAGGDLRWLARADQMDASRLVDLHGYRGDGVVVDCRLDRSGRPDDCVAVSDGDPNAAVLAGEVARLFKAASKDSLGQPVVGRKVRFGFGVSRVTLP